MRDHVPWWLAPQSHDTAWLFFWSGVLPVLTVNAAYAWNLATGLEGCFPYLEGCTSVSRGVREGPGLWLFKLMALPIGLAMALGWLRFAPEYRGRAMIILGITGAVSFFVYAMALGFDGPLYRWMRRYGVVLYFGLAGLAQLLLTARLRGRLLRSVVLLTWGLGVLSAFKRQLFDDPMIIDRFQNALEWNFALGLSLVFIALAFNLRAARK